jgi:hypothetical protein
MTMSDDTRFVVYTIFRDEDDVEALKASTLHIERTKSRHEAHRLAASYVMTLMAGRDGATVREVGQRPVTYLARFEEPARDEIVVVLRHSEEFGLDPVEIWTEATATR